MLATTKLITPIGKTLGKANSSSLLKVAPQLFRTFTFGTNRSVSQLKSRQVHSISTKSSTQNHQLFWKTPMLLNSQNTKINTFSEQLKNKIKQNSFRLFRSIKIIEKMFPKRTPEEILKDKIYKTLKTCTFHVQKVENSLGVIENPEFESMFSNVLKHRCAEIIFIEGAPGSGKTETIKRIMQKQLERPRLYIDDHYYIHLIYGVKFPYSSHDGLPEVKEAIKRYHNSQPFSLKPWQKEKVLVVVEDFYWYTKRAESLMELVDQDMIQLIVISNGIEIPSGHRSNVSKLFFPQLSQQEMKRHLQKNARTGKSMNVSEPEIEKILNIFGPDLNSLSSIYKLISTGKSLEEAIQENLKKKLKQLEDSLRDSPNRKETFDILESLSIVHSTTSNPKILKHLKESRILFENEYLFLKWASKSLKSTFETNLRDLKLNI